MKRTVIVSPLAAMTLLPAIARDTEPRPEVETLLAFVDANRQRVTEPGDFEIMLGPLLAVLHYEK